MKFAAPISLLLLLGCATAVKVPSVADITPPGASQIKLSARLAAQPHTVLAPSPFDPPPGVVIPIPASAQPYPSDFFTSTNLAGPWVYRTDDFFYLTNADGSLSGCLSNAQPNLGIGFILIVPFAAPELLPCNIITNSTANSQ